MNYIASYTYLLVIIFLSNISISIGQGLEKKYQYNSLSNKAKKTLITQKDTTAALRLYDKETKLYGIANDYNDYLKLLAKQKKYNKLEIEFYNAISKVGYEKINIDFIIPDTASFFAKVDKKSFYEQFNQKRKEFFFAKDVDYILEIIKLNTRDQYPRRFELSWFMQDSATNENIIWSVMAKQDSLSIVEMKDLISKYGAPTISRVGNYYQFGVITAMMHACAQFYEHYDYFNDLFKKMLDEDELHPILYSLFVDYTNAHAKGEQIYGRLPDFDLFQKKGIWTYWKIKDIENVDRRRKEIGLLELNLDAMEKNRVIPEGYKLNINPK